MTSNAGNGERRTVAHGSGQQDERQGQQGDREHLDQRGHRRQAKDLSVDDHWGGEPKMLRAVLMMTRYSLPKSTTSSITGLAHRSTSQSVSIPFADYPLQGDYREFSERPGTLRAGQWRALSPASLAIRSGEQTHPCFAGRPPTKFLRSGCGA